MNYEEEAREAVDVHHDFDWPRLDASDIALVLRAAVEKRNLTSFDRAPCAIALAHLMMNLSNEINLGGSWLSEWEYTCWEYVLDGMPERATLEAREEIKAIKHIAKSIDAWPVWDWSSVGGLKLISMSDWHKRYDEFRRKRAGPNSGRG